MYWTNCDITKNDVMAPISCNIVQYVAQAIVSTLIVYRNELYYLLHNSESFIKSRRLR